VVAAATVAMSEWIGVVLLIGAGFVVGAVVQRWWTLALIAGLWVIVDGVVLLRRAGSDATDPSVELLLILMAAVMVVAIVAGYLGILVGRTLSSRSRDTGRPTH
jgi:hypothetical protein